MLARGQKFRAQGGLVFHDAVVHEGKLAAKVRMGVAIGRGAVRGPAGVADAVSPGSGSPAMEATPPFFLRTEKRPSADSSAMPAESYPRYSRRVRAEYSFS